MKVPVQVLQTGKPGAIDFAWGKKGMNRSTVQIRLQAIAEKVTLVTVTEGDKELNDEGTRWLKGNSEGWANFLACLKAWLEFGFNLRKGAFDPSQMREA